MKQVAHKETGFGIILVLVVMLFAIVVVSVLVLTQVEKPSSSKGTGTPISTSTNAPATTTVPLNQSVMTGYIGCSMTRDAVNGYHTVGGTQMWERLEYGGGTLKSWRIGPKSPAVNTYWEKFEAARQLHPNTDAIWWNICISDDELLNNDDEALYVSVVSVLDEIRKRVGTVSVYASSTPGYVDVRVCKKTTPDGLERTNKLLSRLIAEGKVNDGPVFPRLETRQLADSCHPNEEGQRIEGEILKEWF